MSRQFRIKKDFWGRRDVYTKSSVTIKPGFTTLVGCNGSGKSTLLLNIRSKLQKDGIPYISFDNLTEGGDHARDELGDSGNMAGLVERLMSSEGENIWLNLFDFAEKIGNKVRECRSNGDSELWILLDAIDSGLSVNLIVDIKALIFYILKDAQNSGLDVYVVSAANEYELVRGSMPLDTINLKYISIKSYDKYYNVIMKSAEHKQALIDAYEYTLEEQDNEDQQEQYG